MDLEKTYPDGSADCYGNTLVTSEAFGWYQSHMKTTLVVYKLDNHDVNNNIHINAFDNVHNIVNNIVDKVTEEVV